MRSPSICSSPTLTDSNHRNILIVGDVGVGKSSLINLIAGKNLAVTSSCAKSCTLQSQEYSVSLDGIDFTLHDTAGLHEAHGKMKKAEYLDAVYQAYSLISRLEKSGGISLLVFCMKGGRISITSQQTYSLFVEVFCRRQVPVVLVVTHLEMHDPMESWWKQNEKDIKEYGFRSIAHACITATRGLRNVFSKEYEDSRKTIRKLLLEHSDRTVWKEETTNWFKRVVVHMRSWVSPSHAGRLDRKDVKKKLMKRCGFSYNEAHLIAQKMEQVEDAPEEDRSWFDEKLR